MLENILTKLNFRPKEIKVYLEILKSRKISPALLAHKTKLKRTTVYGLLEELKKKGVITEDKASITKQIVALPPEDLEQVTKRERDELEEREYLMKQAVKELRSMEQDAIYPIPKITYVPEIDMKQFLYKRTAAWNESLKSRDSIWWGYQDPGYVEHFADIIDKYWKHPSSKDIYLKFLMNKSDAEEAMKQKQYDRRIIKYWNKTKPFSSGTWVVGDYVVIIRTKKRPFYLVEHHDKELADNLREIFKWIWETVD